MNQVAKTGMNEGTLSAALEQRKITPEVMRVLRTSVWPGAKDESILMAVDMCQARNLNPLKKPVHIVPIWDSKQKCLVDSIWFSINELSITAHRTGQYGGASEPEYGPDVTGKVGNAEMTYPKWCKITVTRVLQGQPCQFTAKVHWLEAYAKKSRDDLTPNAMWLKRPYDQIAKCTLAAGLRIGFPEEIGNVHIMEEAGATIDPAGSIEGNFEETPKEKPQVPEQDAPPKKERPKPAGRREEEPPTPETAEPPITTTAPDLSGIEPTVADPGTLDVYDAKMAIIARWEPGVDEIEAVLTPLRTEISEAETTSALDFILENNDKVFEAINGVDAEAWKTLMQTVAGKRQELSAKLAT